MVQRHAARYVLNKFDRYATVSDMISILGWSTLESRCYTLRTLVMHKIMNKLGRCAHLYNPVTVNFTAKRTYYTKKLQHLPCRVHDYIFSSSDQIMEQFTPALD